MNTKSFKHNIFVVLILSFIPCSFSSEIGGVAELFKDGGLNLGSTNLLGKLEFERNHELMTALSLYCIENINKKNKKWVKKPDKCDFNTANEHITSEVIPLLENRDKKRSEQLEKYKHLVSYVRWPDDPLRMNHTKNPSAVSFAAFVEITCKDIIKNSQQAISWRAGLLCTSHYGNMQFLHSMANKNGVPAYQTRSLINQWSDFAFRFSTNTSLDGKYFCDFWVNEKNREVQKQNSLSSLEPRVYLSDMMYHSSMENEKPCQSRFNVWSIPKNLWFTLTFQPTIDWNYAPWLVGMTFNWQCSSNWKWKMTLSKCNTFKKTDYVHNFERIESNQMSALGSIIHMIQDSFSKAHTVRYPDDSDLRTTPEIVLNPVSEFRSYNGQDENKHKLSDKLPVIVEGINTGKIMDPITASAQVIWLHANFTNKAIVRGSNISQIISDVYGELGKNKLNISKAGSQYEKD